MPDRYLISGGGTGGGVYPALAVAAALKTQRPDAELLWIGSTTGLERDLVTRAGIAFEGVAGGPIAGVGVRALWSIAQIGLGFFAAWGIIRRFKPAALLITGGWPTIAPTLAAWTQRIPVLIFQPDIEPGGAVKALARFAARIAVIADESAAYFPDKDTVVTGYPVRPDLLQAAGYDALGQPLPEWDGAAFKARAGQHFDLKADLPTVLVFGGSRGARSINSALLAGLPDLVAAGGNHDGCQIIHISGTLDSERVRGQAASLPVEVSARYHPVEYLHGEDMALALAAADLVVARAGAGTLGEFPLFGLPAILVPYPHAWRYQKVNADVMASRGAGVRLNDEDLSTGLVPLIRRLLGDEAERQQMAAAMSQLKRPDAAAQIAAALADLATT